MVKKKGPFRAKSNQIKSKVYLKSVQLGTYNIISEELLKPTTQIIYKNKACDLQTHYIQYKELLPPEHEGMNKF